MPGGLYAGVSGGYCSTFICKSIIMVFTPLCPWFGVHKCLEFGPKVLDFLSHPLTGTSTALRYTSLPVRCWWEAAYSPGEITMGWAAGSDQIIRVSGRAEGWVSFSKPGYRKGPLGCPQQGVTTESSYLWQSQSFPLFMPAHFPCPGWIPELVSDCLLPLRSRAPLLLLLPIFFPG